MLLRRGVIVMGEGSYGEPAVISFSPVNATLPHLVIGRYCSIAEGVTILVNADHNVGWVSTYPMRIKFGLPGANSDGHPSTTGPVVVGNDVWIGYGATVLGGVRIGDGAVVGAGSVVARDVPPYTIVAGNPAREIKRRFDDTTIAQLLDLKWWDLDHDSVTDLADLLCGPPDTSALAQRILTVRSRGSLTSRSSERI